MVDDRRLVSVSAIVKRFGSNTALNDVSIDVARGEVHAIVGENGAGKSTLMNIINGALQPDEGTIAVDGKVLHFSGPSDALASGIAMVHQEPKLAAPLTVAENVYMGRLPRKAGGVVDAGALRRNTDQVLSDLGLPLKANDVVGQLPIAARQFVQFAKAVTLDARLIILDEPTASLTPVDTAQLFALMRRLKERGTAFIYISHHLDEIFEIADRVSVLKDGSLVTTLDVGETDKAELIRYMVGRDLAAHFPDHGERAAGEVALRAEGISGRGFRNVSLELRRGEIVGLAGLIGAGRTELARALCGAERITGGRLVRDGKPVKFGSASDGTAAGIAYLAEDRRDSVLRPLSVMHNITLAARNDLAHYGIMRSAKERAVAADYAQRLKVRATGIDQLAGQLSGGNQQKCVIARWLLRDSEVLIFDEPTRGIDIGTKREIYQLIHALAAEGRAILMISSELPEVLGMGDRILVMEGGRISGELSRAQATEPAIMELAVPQTKKERMHG
ncbi:sugar ABC transporter ATP-binding protein [Propylenella binzhouense]|uniref:Sugar ABC transporter ATP-binding protein n=1 Tax=Propylenella binzhouense TaxID=2555902 RepID=A0A964T268_9HYPH|nr:sugar ABC transporter ATP-binding protein [Propylenella binzhouense]MYZ47038.1 sugar ABC transporter ATP-binding protein [Propylenella binzhouense]